MSRSVGNLSRVRSRLVRIMNWNTTKVVFQTYQRCPFGGVSYGASLGTVMVTALHSHIQY